MQEHQSANKETKESEQEDRVRDFLSRRAISGIAIAFWVFVGSFFLLRLYINDHIVADPARTTVLIDAMLNLAIVVVIIVHAVMYYRQAEAANRQIEITDRPWMKFEAKLTEPLTFSDQGGADCELLVSAKNVGRSVALNTTLNAIPIVPRRALGGRPWEEVLAKQKQLCERVGSVVDAYAIFPDDAYTIPLRINLSGEQLGQGIQARFKDIDVIDLYLVGCVDYQFVGHERHHQTRFAYQIIRKKPGNPYAMSLQIGKDIPLIELTLVKMFMGGDYAD